MCWPCWARLFTQLLQRYSCCVTCKSSITAVTCQLWRGKTRCSVLMCAVLHACQVAWHAVLCCAVLCRAGSHCLTGCVASSTDADSPIVTQCRIPSSIKHVHSPGACIRWARNRRPVFHTSVEPPSSCCCDTSRADATARAAMSAELLAEHCFFGLFCVSFALFFCLIDFCLFLHSCAGNIHPAVDMHRHTGNHAAALH